MSLRWVPLAAAALWLFGSALLLPHRSQGDAGEYLMMTESLFRHLSPELRTADVRSVASSSLASGYAINFSDVYRGYYEGLDGRRYSYHFWAYSMAGLPARLLMQVHGDRLRALPLTNAVLLVWALFALVRSPALDRAGKAALFGLTLGSPAIAFLLWPHPEIFSFVGVTLALLWSRERHDTRAVLAAAVASMQNPPLVFLWLALWVRAVWGVRGARGSAQRILDNSEEGLCPDERRRAESVSGPAVPPGTPVAPQGGATGVNKVTQASGTMRSLLWPSLASLPLAAPAVFYLWKFHTPSLVAREATRWDALSIGKALELFFDLNLGMGPYLPLTLGAFALAVILALIRRRGFEAPAAAALLLVMALASSTTVSWNHGTSGPSRYTIWMLPLVFFGLLVLREHIKPRTFALVMAVAVVSQAALLLVRGGPGAPADYLEHSAAARLALRHVPALYNPSHEIFTSRTSHQVLHADSALAEPVVYRTEAGCHKAWARPEDLDALTAACGPPRPDAAAALRRRPPGGWGYVHW